jgi:diacylglycerol kinase family enzyme
MRRAALIYNPTAGGGRRIGRLEGALAALRDGGFAVEPAPTSGPGEATEIARRLAAERAAEVVVAFGGDGTVREVAAGLLGSEVALGIVPAGTTNVLARALGLPPEPRAAAAVLASLPARPLDVGLAGATPFLMMVSAGLDASLLAALDGEMKRRFGRAGMAAQGIAHWWRYAYPALEVEADGRPVRASFAAVSNIPLYAGPYRLSPAADPGDRRLDLLLFTGTGRGATLSFALDLFRGAHLRRPDVAVAQVGEVVLHGPPGACAQVDGDLCREELPVRIRLAAASVRVLAPLPGSA